ncbi:hypothetical protein Agub_g5712, partial [Astrephomene gubernaculifera]
MDPQVVHRLRRLLLFHPDGLPIHLVPHNWQVAYGVPLLPHLLGYQSCSQLLAAAPQAASIGPPPEYRVTAVLTAAGVEELFEYVRSEVEGLPPADALGHGRAQPQQGRHVSYELVLSAMQYYLANRPLESYGLPPPRGLQELMHLDRRVGAAVEAFCAGRCVVSLWELQRHICTTEVVPEYGRLRLGPLAAHPAVRRVFFSSPPAAAAAAGGPPGQPPSAPPLPAYAQDPGAAIPHISAFDVAAAVRRQLAVRGVKACRAAAAAGVASAQGAALVSAVLEDVAAAAGMPVVPTASNCNPPGQQSQAGPAPRSGHSASQPLPQQPCTPLAWRLGVAVFDLLLYVNIAAAAIEGEQAAALRGAAGAVRQEAPLPPPASAPAQAVKEEDSGPRRKSKKEEKKNQKKKLQGAAEEPQQQPQQGAGTAAAAANPGGARRGVQPQAAPLLVDPSHYGFLSPSQQAALSRRQLKDMFIPSTRRGPHPHPHQQLPAAPPAGAAARRMSDALAALREEREGAGAAAAARTVTTAEELEADDDEEDDSSDSDSGDEESSSSSSSGDSSSSSSSGDSSSDEESSSSSSSSSDDDSDTSAESDSDRGRGGKRRQLSDARRSSQKKANVRRTRGGSGDDSEEEEEEEDGGGSDGGDEVGLLLGGLANPGAQLPRVPGPLECSAEARQSLGKLHGLPANYNADQLQAAFQRLLSQVLGGARVQAQPERSFYVSVVALLVQQFVAPIIRAQAGSKSAQPKGRKALAAKVAHIEQKYSASPLIHMLLRALHAAMRGRMPVHEAQMAAVREYDKEAVALAEATVVQTATANVRQKSQGGRGSGQAPRKGGAAAKAGVEKSISSSEEEDDDGDAPYIRDAAGRAALRGKVVGEGRRVGVLGGAGKRRQKKAAEAGSGGQGAAAAVISVNAQQGVVSSLLAVEAALVAARPAAGWTPEALACLRTRLFQCEGGRGGSGDDAGAAAGAGGRGSQQVGPYFGSAKMRALATFFDFMVRGQLAQAAPEQQQQPLPQQQQPQELQQQQQPQHEQLQRPQQQQQQGASNPAPTAPAEAPAELPACQLPRAHILAALR